MDVVQEARPYDIETHTAYLRWYVPRTRSCLTSAAPQRPTEVTHDAAVLAGPDTHRAARQEDTVKYSSQFLSKRNVSKFFSVSLQYESLQRINAEVAQGLRRGRTNTGSQIFGMMQRVLHDSATAMRTISCGRHSDIAGRRRGHGGQPPSPPPSAPPSAPPSTRPSHSGSRRSHTRPSSTLLGLGQAVC